MRYNYGNVFLEAYFNAQKRKQDQEQFDAELAQRQSESFMNSDYRNRALSQDESQFSRSLAQKQSESNRNYGISLANIGLEKRGLDLRALQGDREYDLGKGGLLARNKEIGLGYSRLAEDTRQFDESMKFKEKELGQEGILGAAKINATSMKDLDKLKGNLQNSLSILQSGKYSGEDYAKAKSDANGTVAEALKLAGLDYNGDVMNQLRSVINEDDSPEDKRKYLSAGIAELQKQGKINEEQVSILKYWKEIGTR